MKSLPRVVLSFYLLVLLWLVLFKFSTDIATVLADFQTRNLNLIPFADSLRGEMLSNFIVFIPFGLLLGVNLKQTPFWQKLSVIFLFSLIVEVTQFVLAIGMTDITDLITNTLGGLFGLVLYDSIKKYVNNKWLDLFIAIGGMILLVIFILLRFFVFKVKY